MTVAERPRWPPGVVRRGPPPPGPALPPARPARAVGADASPSSPGSRTPAPAALRPGLPGGTAMRGSSVIDRADDDRGGRRKAADDEAEPLDRMARRHLVHAPQDLRAEIGQLVGPHRGRALDGELPAAERLGARAAAHRVPDSARPRGVRARLVATDQPAERRRDDVSEPAWQVAPGPACRLLPARASGGPPLAALPVAAHSASSAGCAGGVSSSGGTAWPAASEPSNGSSMTVARSSSSSVK